MTDLAGRADSAPFPSPARRYGLNFWLTLSLVLAAVTVRIGFIAFPFHSDAGLYAYMGKVVAEGGTLYRDFYENKPPGVGLFASIFSHSFGWHWAGYVLVQLAMTLLASLLLARAAARSAGHSARLPTFLFAITFFNFGWAVFTGFQLETMQAFFAALAAAAAVEALTTLDLRDTLCVGLAAGCAAMIKPSGLAVAAAFSLVLLTQSRSLGLRRLFAHALALTLGIAIPTAVVLFWCYATNILGQLPELFHQIALYGSQSPMDSVTPVKLAVVSLLLGFPMLIRGWVFRRPSWNPSPAKAPATIIYFALTWLFLEALGIFLQGRMYLYHFLPLAPAAALVYGLLPRSNKPVPMGLGLLPLALMSVMWEGSLPGEIARGLHRRPLSDYLLAHTQPGDSIFADQMGRLLLETDLRPGSRYGIFYYWVNYDTAAFDYGDRMLADFDQRRPKYILIARGADQTMHEMANGPILSHCPTRKANVFKEWSKFRQYVTQNYQLEDVLENNEIYRRKPATPAGNLAAGD